ncbi:hydroxypyruvate isomerase family protein [Maribacter cobaltidurans]|uniref:Hydroxypyruvate isomerase n=1 Tax=Maribacter cobaltidurans TaxID=1178778 RepID=A0A223V8A4_9FLAO|nr:TIM barrel protein [Maribacter cobaltidurans]ASV31370.1 hydroxypyruvate isomerase [Maribacter cobaltidurans]GGD82853.1 hydroxypyruvate isomerase [Maribacter cobaltidurans]
MKRRDFIGTSAAASVGFMASAKTGTGTNLSEKPFKLKHNINHSACYWCYGSIPFETFLQELNKLDIRAIDLVDAEQFPLLKKYNIHASMCWGAGLGIEKGWNDPQYHKELIADYKRVIPLVAEGGYTNLICFSGNRNGMNDMVGLRNCAKGLKEIIPLAEEHGVVIQMELLNSKVNHKDYMCDKSEWGVSLCETIGSDNFKLLYDIYHMQIMEGDIIRNIQDYHQYYGHYHTGGNPGRHEIDETQEIFYPAVMKAILETGYTGHVAQEFVPSWEDKIAALKQGVTICDV